jgi:DNA-binding LytR/AlgR family response regulator
MKPITCLVVDDEQYSVDLLCGYVNRTPFLQLVFAATNPIEAADWLGRHPVQLCITDIKMPGLNGLELIEALHGRTKFILCTAHSNYALQGFEYDVVDYLMKPVVYPRFLRAAQKARQLLQPAAEQYVNDALYITGKTKSQFIKVPTASILYIEASNNYITLHTQTAQHIWHCTMKEVMELLPPGFCRVHKSFSIKLSAIKSIDGNTVILEDATVIPVGPTYKPAFDAALGLNQ